MVPGVDGELGQGDPQDPVGDGGDGEQVIGGSVVALDIYADLLTTFGPSGGHPQLMRVNPEGVWDRVSSSIHAEAAKRGTLIDLTTGADVTDAIRAALALGAIDGYGLLLFTPGTGLISELIEHGSAYNNIILVGAGSGVSTLKQAGGSNLDVVYRFGEASGTTKTSRVGASHITFDGNEAGNSASSPEATVKCYNVGLSTFDDIEVIESEGVGIRATGDNIDSSTLNKWSRILLRYNNAGGGHWSDLKYNQFSMIVGDNNDKSYGLQFSGGTTEFTQNSLNNIIAQGNGDDVSATDTAGLILKGIARCPIQGIEANANAGPGVSMRVHSGGVSTTNSGIITGINCRRNSDGAGETVQGVEILTATGLIMHGVRIQGGAPSEVDKVGMYVENASRFDIAGVHIVDTDGTALYAESCTDGDFRGLNLIANGNTGSTNNHGVRLVSCTGVSVQGQSKNDYTTGSSYEFSVETNSRRIFCDMELAAASAGNEIEVEAVAYKNVTYAKRCVRENTQYTPTVVLVDDTTNGSGNQTITLPQEAAMIGTCTLDGTAGAVTIANFTDMADGTVIHIVFLDSNVTLVHGTMKCNGGANIVGDTNKMVTVTWARGGVSYAMDGAV